MLVSPLKCHVTTLWGLPTCYTKVNVFVAAKLADSLHKLVQTQTPGFADDILCKLAEGIRPLVQHNMDEEKAESKEALIKQVMLCPKVQVDFIPCLHIFI